jgi:hypothetical protein
VDSYGNAYEETAYYDATIGGIDINTDWAGPDASVYFPSLDTGYLMFNGYWVDRDGSYWDQGRRVYLDSPRWRDRWSGYWRSHTHDYRGRWDQRGWKNRKHGEWHRKHYHHDDRVSKDKWRTNDHDRSGHNDRRNRNADIKQSQRPIEAQAEHSKVSNKRDLNTPKEASMSGKNLDRNSDRNPQNDNKHGTDKH